MEFKGDKSCSWGSCWRQRLAVALDGAQRQVVVFATAYEPILTLRMLGSIPLSPGLIHISHQQQQLSFNIPGTWYICGTFGTRFDYSLTVRMRSKQRMGVWLLHYLSAACACRWVKQ